MKRGRVRKLAPSGGWQLADGTSGSSTAGGGGRASGCGRRRSGWRRTSVTSEEADSAGPVKWVAPAWEVLAADRRGPERGCVMAVAVSTRVASLWSTGSRAGRAKRAAATAAAPCPASRPVWVGRYCPCLGKVRGTASGATHSPRPQLAPKPAAALILYILRAVQRAGQLHTQPLNLIGPHNAQGGNACRGNRGAGGQPRSRGAHGARTRCPSSRAAQHPQSHPPHRVV
jgi:hypothetical protein